MAGAEGAAAGSADETGSRGRGRVGGRERGGRWRGWVLGAAVGEQVAEGEQAGAGGFEDGDAGRAQPGRGVGVDRGRDGGEDDDRLVGRGRGGEDGVAVGVVAVVLRDQVDGQRDRADVGVVGQRGQRLGEQFLGVPAGPPDVERVAGFEAGVEDRRQPFPRLARSAGRTGRRRRRPRPRRAPARTRSRARWRVPAGPGQRRPRRGGRRRTAPACPRARPGRRRGARRGRTPAPARRRRRPRGRRSGRRPGTGSRPRCRPRAARPGRRGRRRRRGRNGAGPRP